MFMACGMILKTFSHPMIWTIAATSTCCCVRVARRVESILCRLYRHGLGSLHSGNHFLAWRGFGHIFCGEHSLNLGERSCGIDAVLRGHAIAAEKCSEAGAEKSNKAGIG